MLRLSELTERIAHLPRILYHWRKLPGSVASSPGAKNGIAELQAAAVARTSNGSGSRPPCGPTPLPAPRDRPAGAARDRGRA